MSRPVLLAALGAFVSLQPAMANDSTAELGNGGLLLTRSGAIQLVSEDLYLSMDEVRVDYVFKNRKDEAVETVVAFPMPDLSGGIDNNIAVPTDAPDNFLGFSTTIDGKPVTAQLDQHAVVAGIDVTDEIKAHGVPLYPFGEATSDAIKSLAADVMDDWVTRGLLEKMEFNAGKGWQTAYYPLWTLRSAYWWRAIFPAGAEIRVAHRYTPSVGASAGLGFVYDGKPTEMYDDYARKYCVDDAFMRAVARAEKANDYVQEKRLDYVLTSGGNWANGTIGRFHLTVDKGSSDTLVSFCGEGVKKTGPTTFEMVSEDFYPEQDIHILFVAPPPAQ